MNLALPVQAVFSSDVKVPGRLDWYGIADTYQDQIKIHSSYDCFEHLLTLNMLSRWCTCLCQGENSSHTDCDNSHIHEKASAWHWY